MALRSALAFGLQTVGDKLDLDHLHCAVRHAMEVYIHEVKRRFISSASDLKPRCLCSALVRKRMRFEIEPEAIGAKAALLIGARRRGPRRTL